MYAPVRCSPSLKEGQEPVRIRVGVRVGRGLGDLGQLRAGTELGLGRAHGRGLRIGVGDARDRLVVGLAWFAEDVRGDHLALILADMGQLQDACDVSDRPQLVAGTQVGIDWDSSGARGHANGLEPDPLDPRTPSGRHQQMITAQLPSILHARMPTERSHCPNSGSG